MISEITKRQFHLHTSNLGSMIAQSMVFLLVRFGENTCLVEVLFN